MAVYGWMQDEGRTTNDEIGPSSFVIRHRWAIALGAVRATPLRAPEAEAALAADTSPQGIRRAAELAAAAARPIDDIRASAAYRRAMVAVLVRRGIESDARRSSSSFVLGPLSAGGAPSSDSGGTA